MARAYYGVLSAGTYSCNAARQRGTGEAGRLLRDGGGSQLTGSTAGLPKMPGEKQDGQEEQEEQEEQEVAARLVGACEAGRESDVLELLTAHVSL